MHWVIAIGALALAGVLGATSLIDEINESQDSITSTTTNIGGLALVAIGGYLVWKQLQTK